jgi:4-alpha-glucanotransferase
VHRLLGVGPTPAVPECFVDAAYASRAALAIVPFQDLLALGSAARMNTPGTVVGNWRWRFAWDDVPPSLAATCAERATRSLRRPQSSERYSSS